MDELTIGEVARAAGLRPSAIRYYESIGILPEPRRVSGRRRYNPRVLQQLALIQLAQESGFTLTEIKILLHGFEVETPPSTRWRALARQKLAEADALIQRAQRMKRLLETGLNCDCLRFEDCVVVLGEGCVNDGESDPV